MKYIKKGFTLVELIIVISILAILIVIIVPKFNTYTKKVSKVVCNINCVNLEKSYTTYLIVEKMKHGENIFEKYLKEYGKGICPKQGIISYENEKIRCNIHSKEDEEIEEIPYI